MRPRDSRPKRIYARSTALDPVSIWLDIQDAAVYLLTIVLGNRMIMCPKTSHGLGLEDARMEAHDLQF